MDPGVLSSMHLNKMQLGDHGIAGLNWVEGTICSILLLLFYLGTIPGYTWDQTRVSDTGKRYPRDPISGDVNNRNVQRLQKPCWFMMFMISSGGCSPTL